ncbi:DNA cytosine methyltransferase [Streptomyces sp. KN37]|uniref:DNA cytosine methyltransferase n=1 Tax=Streptomyces sp. KN37 TaxID=3090667 RepID=UPI002A756120|nr:DNA cytosine methyltransferase [Streptomyces sp. KN37]WPO73985.1 DNA cytosine methyltransferase [Streptomyces sp. KN37]
MTNLSLCSGAGTLDLAVEQITGNKTLVYAENDPFASRVMEARFPWATNLGDITTADWAGVASQWQIETLSAGFPCRNISNAGPRDGINGKWSSVWKNVAQAVGVIRPSLVFLENVEALRSRGLNVVVEDLAALGYGLWWTCVPARDVGAPHLRWRWFGLGYPVAQNPDVAAWRERWASAPGQAQSRGAWTDLGGRSGLPAAAAGIELLPTPAARDWKSGASNLMGLNSRPLNEFVVNRLPRRGSWVATNGVDYGPAIRRWEAVTGRPAPEPTEPGERCNRRLSPVFTEWMQGDDEGWVTDLDIPRNAQLTILGNQAITRQAVEGYRRLLCADLEAMAA